MWLKNEKGFTTMELFLLLPFALFLAGVLFTIGGHTMIRNTVNTAAREAARYAASHDQYGPNTEAWEEAVQTVKNTHMASWSLGAGDSTTPHQAFDPLNQNPNTPDVTVELTDDGDACATVTYHLPTPLPGMAKLLDADAAMMTKYMDISAKSYFKAE